MSKKLRSMKSPRKEAASKDTEGQKEEAAVDEQLRSAAESESQERGKRFELLNGKLVFKQMDQNKTFKLQKSPQS